VREKSNLLILALLLLAAPVRAAEVTANDDALVKACTGELEDRLFGGGAHGEAFIVAKDIQHQGERTSVHLDLASGEGRKIDGTCIFRSGKLFDVKQ
jgi:hypothetical protein